MTYQCCFCADAIMTSRHGVRVVLTALEPGGAAQEMFAHVTCLDERFAPTLAAGTPFCAEAFGPD